MPYYLSLFLISLVGGFFIWKKFDTEKTSQTDYAGIIKTYRSVGWVMIICAILSFGALIVSIVLRLDSYKFDFGWGSVALVQMLFWVFAYFAFIKPQLHECEKMLEWTTR